MVLMEKAILLIGNTKSRSVQRLKEEAVQSGVVFDAVAPARLHFKNGVCIVEGVTLSRDVLAYDTYFFRGMGLRREKEMQPIAAFLAQQGKRVVEQCFTKGMMPIDKEVPVSQHNLYQVPKSAVITKETYRDVLKDFTFPLVVKKPYSSMGRGVRKIVSEEELSAFVHATDEVVILQEYHEISFDTRVMVVGGKVLGGLRRYKKEGEDFLTTLPGGVREAVTLTEDEVRAVQEARQLQGLEITGIDMFTDKGVTYIIEVNASPQFRVFEKHTGVNVAKEIVEYLL